MFLIEGVLLAALGGVLTQPEQSAVLELKREPYSESGLALTIPLRGIKYQFKYEEGSVQARVRNGWTQLDACAETTGAAVSPESVGCATARFIISGPLLTQDRTYPPLVQIGSSGVLVHTSYFAPENAGAILTVKTTTPGDVVAAKGRVYDTEMFVPFADVASDYVYLGAPPDEVIGEVQVFYEGSVATWARREVRKLLADFNQEWRIPPSVVVIDAEPDAGEARIHADVTSATMLRMSLIGDVWAEPVPDSARSITLQSTLVHELIHVLQGESGHAQESTPWVVEGSAEYAARNWLLRTGRITKAEFVRVADGYINRCLMTIGNASWVAMRNKNTGSTPYECGFLFAMMGMRGKGCDTDTPVLGIATPRHVLDEAALLARADECGNSKPLALVLQGSDRAVVEAALREGLAGAGIEFQLVPAVSHPAGEGSGPSATSVFELMVSACNGAGGVTNKDAQLITDPIRSCLPFQDGRVIESTMGYLVPDGIAFSKSVARACRSAGRVLLTGPDGSFVVPCTEEVYDPPTDLIDVLDMRSPNCAHHSNDKKEVR